MGQSESQAECLAHLGWQAIESAWRPGALCWEPVAEIPIADSVAEVYASFPKQTRTRWSTITPRRKSVGYFAAVRLSDGPFFFRRETVVSNGEIF